MRRIRFEYLKVLFRYSLNGFWKTLEAFPKAVCCPVHLEISELSLSFFFNGFFD